MGARVISSAEELKGLLGQQLGVTAWLTVDQERVEGFAKVTGDHQWIHVDTERAKQSPFGGTIAHGFLTLALTVPFGAELYELDSGSSRLNYGLNKVRFPAPVPVGSRIRAQVTLDEIRETGAGLQLTTTYTIKSEGKERPACVAERLTPRHPPDQRNHAMTNLEDLPEEEREIVALVRRFVDKDVKPTVQELEHANTYPEQHIEKMKELGVYGLAIDEPWGDGKVSTACYVLVTEELARGWMSLAGAMGGHTVVAKLLQDYGTAGQKEKYLKRMATGELRATMALTEPGGGSDLQNMRTTARPDGSSYRVNGSKTWISNARRSGLIALLCKTDPDASPAHKGVSILLVDKEEVGDRLTISRDLPKLGYKGVESCELVFEDMVVPGDTVLGGVEGQGFAQIMRGLEVGRLQVAARALGVGRAALEDALRYAQERESFGVPIWQHQSIGHYLANMATKLTAARQLTLHAAQVYDSGRRADMEAGMAKLFSSEVGMEIALDAIRIHGGMGYSTEFDVERYFRDAPLMIVGEGTNEIQRNVIAKQLVQRNSVAP